MGAHDPPARDRVVCEARRTWSRLLTPWPPGTPPERSTTTRHEGSDSPYAINTATVQPCRIDRPGSPRPTVDPPARDRVICEAKRIWSHHFLLDLRKACRALQHGPRKWPGLSVHYQLTRLCPSIHTFSHERIPSGHSSLAEQIALPRPNPRSRLPRETGGSLRQGAREDAGP